MGFEFPRQAGVIQPFSTLNSTFRLRVADSIHLPCAASAGIDLFLTVDQRLLNLERIST